MMPMSHMVYIVLSGLLFAVLSATHLLILNEELLILLSFIAFVATAIHAGGDAIHDMFQSRKQAIQDELNMALDMKAELLQTLKQHTTAHTHLAHATQAIAQLLHAELQHVHTNSHQALENAVQAHFTGHLHTLQTAQSQGAMTLQHSIAHALPSHMAHMMALQGQKAHDGIFAQQLQTLGTLRASMKRQRAALTRASQWVRKQA